MKLDCTTIDTERASYHCRLMLMAIMDLTRNGRKSPKGFDCLQPLIDKISFDADDGEEEDGEELEGDDQDDRPDDDDMDGGRPKKKDPDSKKCPSKDEPADKHKTEESNGSDKHGGSNDKMEESNGSDKQGDADDEHAPIVKVDELANLCFTIPTRPVPDSFTFCLQPSTLSIASILRGCQSRG